MGTKTKKGMAINCSETINIAPYNPQNFDCGQIKGLQLL
jgi:hypothetical protein